MKAITTNNLKKKYGDIIGIENLNLSVDEGDFFGFIGPNGAGKSTTIRTLLGLIAPTSGEASIFDMDIVGDHDKILDSIGYLPSEINFYNKMTVKEVIKLSVDMRKKDCSKKAEELCERLNLDTSKKVDALSLGNRKKVGIICAIQHQPKLLILDEPTSGLDPLMQKEFFKILSEENSNGSTVFLSSHILSEVQSYCHTAAFIKDGRIIVSDKVEKLEETGAKKITFSGTFDTTTLKGVSDLQQNEGTTSFLYTGDIKKLLRLMSESEIKDLTITEPTLEEIFMNYYEA
ncbi:MAG: ABC transporter ATP-binding protein [Lachnospiraceae bacterium]|nr:ABC transporter ATP-binding protein [Lachnospiraceae bacterium]